MGAEESAGRGPLLEARENPRPGGELDLMARLLHRDGLMLVIDKPAGWPVHRGPKGGPSLEDYFDQLRFGLPRAPALAHRLDKDTSGCLVLGRHRKALEILGKLFKHGAIEKTYWAVVEGGPAEESGVIDLGLSRLDAQRGWWMQTDPLGLPARTNWRVLGRGSGERRRAADMDRVSAAHRAHASAAGARRGHGLAHSRRSHLWLGPSRRSAAAASACARARRAVQAREAACRG